MWKPIKDWEDLYMVNEFGDVKNIVTGNTIVGDDNGSGYKRVKLWRNKQSEMKYRHRLVAETFIPNPNNLPEVNHIDSNRSNNHIDNLEWVSRKQNKRHSQIYGNEKYKPFIVYYNNGEIATFDTQQELAALLKVSKPTVRYWLQNKNQGYLKHNISKIEYIKK